MRSLSVMVDSAADPSSRAPRPRSSRTPAGVVARSSRPKPASATTASNATSRAPVRILAVSPTASPSVMNVPRPPLATRAPSVAVAMIWTEAVRMPAMITGPASGSSTWRSTSRCRMPIPRAASTTAGSTWPPPTYALVRIGGLPSSTSAKITVWGCRPPQGKASALSARLGRARPTLDALIARNEPLPVWASHSAGGSASAIAITSEMTESSRCSSTRWTTAAWLSAMNCRTPLTASPSSSGGPPRPRRDHPLHAEEREVRDHRQRDRQHRAEQHLGHEELREALGDEGSEIVHADRGGDRDQADRGDGGDPEPGDDHRQREWEVDLEQHLPW